MENSKYIYLVFSSTPFKTGRFIRKMLGERYNHVSLALDPSLKTLYSFARYYRDTLFYGGFIKENALRYNYNQQRADIKVCAVPITEAQLKYIACRLFLMNSNAGAYRYNLLSAIFMPLHTRVAAENAFTCIEFVVKMLSDCGIGDIVSDRFYRLSELQELFEDFVSYEGQYSAVYDGISPETDVYLSKRNITVRAGLTVWSNAALLGRVFKGKFIHR